MTARELTATDDRRAVNDTREQPQPAMSEARQRRLEGVLSMTDVSLDYLSLEDVLSELLERIRVSMGVDTVAVLLLDEARGVLLARAAKGIEEEVRQGVQVPLARGFAGRVAAENHPVIIEDLGRAEVVNPLLRQRGIRSLLGVPLHVNGSVIGVLHIGSLRYRTFGEDDVHMLELAAGSAAIAIDAARLSEQRAVTELMQRTLLPEALPEIPGLRLSAKYLPAASGIGIGGDWYDVFQLASGRVAFVIGDVVGRGVVAASVMAEIRTALRAYILEGHDLARGMSLLNDLVVLMGRNRSATAAIFALDPDEQTLSCTSAGHLPPLLLRPGSEPSFVTDARGLPLGVSAGVEYTVHSVPFPVGSTLLLYTDGLVERRGEPIDLGLERLASAASTEVGDLERRFADVVYGELVPDESLPDDVALLAVESIPLGETFEMTLLASPRVLAGMRRTIGRWLINHGVPTPERFDITVAASEAAGNAIEHAYGPHEAQFHISCSWSPGRVVVRVSDAGTWRAPASHRRGRGRGLMIMRELMDEVDVRQEHTGTTVTLIKGLPERP